METYVLGGPGGGVTVSAVEDGEIRVEDGEIRVEDGEVLVAAISATDKMTNVIKRLVQQVESLEIKVNQQILNSLWLSREGSVSNNARKTVQALLAQSQRTNEPVHFLKNLLEVWKCLLPGPHSDEWP